MRRGRPAGWQDRRGTVALEFAIIGPVLVVVIMAIIEFTLQAAVGALIESAGREASRFGITGRPVPPGMEGEPPASREEAIRRIVIERGAGLLEADRLTIDLRAYADIAAVGEDGAGVEGAGAADQVVVYELSYRQPLLIDAFVPVLGLGALVHHATIIVKNEPAATL